MTPWVAAGRSLCADRDGDTEAAAEAVYGGTVVIANNSDLTDMNPLVAGEKYSQEVNRFMLFLPLVRMRRICHWSPCSPSAGTCWAIPASSSICDETCAGTTECRPPRATSCSRSSARRIPETAFPNAEYFRSWTGVEATDSFTVRFTFEPHMDPLAGWAFLPIAPAHLLDSIPSARMLQAAFNRRPVGNGPFRFVEYRQNDRWVFEANPDFPRPWAAGPMWIVSSGGRSRTRPRSSRSFAGGADIVLTPVAEQFTAISAREGFRGIDKPSRQYANVIWNGRLPPLDDANVRRALGSGHKSAADHPGSARRLRRSGGRPDRTLALGI
jgi:hypothetical protein